MRLIGYWILYWILRGLVSLRFRIKVTGMEALQSKPSRGVLILPNHPAEIDPLILMIVLWPRYRPRPLVVEHFYYQKGLRFFMDLVGALPLPTMDIANPWKVRQVEKLKARVLSGLKEGENFLIYPSGKLKTTPEEQVGGASMVHDFLAQAPDTNMLLVRTTGLWGSHFSRALSNETPDFAKVTWEGFFKVLLKNGLFFAPRREVKVELEWAPDNFPRKGSRLEVNRALDEWYNRSGPEPLTLVSTVFWKENLPKVEKDEHKARSNKPVPKEVEQEVFAQLSKVSRRPFDQIQYQQSLSNDLGLDSLDVAQFYLFLEERYGISPIVPGQLQTVGELLQAAVGEKKEIEGVKAPKKRPKWPSESRRPEVQMPEGATLQEVFLRCCDRMGSAIACADQMTPAISYQKLKSRALVLSLKIAEMPGDKIGVMLPASVAAYAVVLAVLLAGKVPVMLNWTAGSRSIEHCAKLCDLKVVLSSYRFLSRVDGVDLGNVDDLLLLLEETRREISLKMKIKGLLLSFKKAAHLLKPVNPEDPAVIIFTSGTETLPKGVPLTHTNILSDQRAALTCVQLKSSDILYGVLPPFHSFGLTVTGFLPLFTGIKVCFSPDPTDGRALATNIEHWKPTLFCCAPSFIQTLLRVAKPEQLKSLRLTVTGAEKAPDALFEAFEKMEKRLIEGYGVSECSPIVTLQREWEPRRGVGRPIPGVDLKIHEEEVLIAGPIVFKGYLGDVPPPFIELEGKRWYRTGDRGTLEPDGTLMLTGRLKRFIKIGGEMVSLGGIEEELMQLAPKSDKPVLAVSSMGQDGEKAEIVVFTTFPLTREAASQFLKDRGHARLVKIAEVRQIGEIPLTGTGKTHYRLLDELLQKK